jgi:putative inorganic carbon (hco3(-)) transporter
MNILWIIETTLLGISVPLLMFPSLKPLATAGLLLLSVVWWAVRWRIDGQLISPSPFNGGLLLWAIAVGIGTMVSAFPELTLSKVSGLALGLISFRYLIVNISNRYRLKWAILAFFGLGLVIALVGAAATDWHFKVPVLERLINRLPPQMVQLPGAPDAGVNANQLGGTLTIYVPFSLAWLLSWRARSSPWLSLILRLLLLGIFGGLLILSQSRSAWIGGVIGCWTVLILGSFSSERRWLRRVAVALLTVSMLVVGILFIWVGTDPIISLWESAGGVETDVVGQISLMGRVEIWSRALYTIQDFSFTGCGLGTFREVVWILYPLFRISPSSEVAHAHNIFLQAAVDTGVPGLIAYLSLLGIGGVVGWRIIQQSGGRHRWLVFGLMSGLLALHIYGLTDALAPGSKPGLVFWVVLGLLAAMDRLHNRALMPQRYRE